MVSGARISRSAPDRPGTRSRSGQFRRHVRSTSRRGRVACRSCLCLPREFARRARAVVPGGPRLAVGAHCVDCRRTPGNGDLLFWPELRHRPASLAGPVWVLSRIIDRHGDSLASPEPLEIPPVSLDAQSRVSGSGRGMAWRKSWPFMIASLAAPLMHRCPKRHMATPEIPRGVFHTPTSRRRSVCPARGVGISERNHPSVTLGRVDWII
jgi:hypothetical protein